MNQFYQCHNLKCRDLTRSRWLCPACRRLGKQALFWGTLVGAALAELIRRLA